MLLNSGQIVVENEKILLVGAADLLFEFPAFDGGGQVDFARRQPPQHNRGNGEIDRLPDVAFAVLDGTPAVQDDDLLGLATQQRQQPLVGDDVVVAFGRRRHFGALEITNKTPSANTKHSLCQKL